MGRRIDKLLGAPADRAAYKTAKTDQHDLQRREEAAGITEETPEYLAANDRTNAAAKKLPWLGR